MFPRLIEMWILFLWDEGLSSVAGGCQRRNPERHSPTNVKRNCIDLSRQNRVLISRTLRLLVQNNFSTIYWETLCRLNPEILSLLKMTTFWSIDPCGLVEVDRRFRGNYCLYHQGDYTCKTSAHVNETTGRHVSQDRRLYTRCRENLRSHNSLCFSYITEFCASNM
jgi:hypothetical protein